MKYKGQHNIITDADITMTGQLIGHSLSEVIDSQQSDINTLKSNVKWIYKYGGVGSGGSGGGGTQSTAPWNFRVELDDVVREHGSTVNLGKQKEYKLTVSLYKVQGRTFTVKYTYTTELGPKVKEKIILPTQSSSLTDTINLQVNGILSVAINDDEGNTALFLMDYIVTAYNFTINYATSDGTPNISNNNVFVDGVPEFNYVPYSPVNNNIFVSDVEETGLVIDLYCTIAVDIIEGYIEYTDWNGTEIKTIPITKGSYHVYLPVGKEINNDNSGNYTFSISPHLTLDGNSIPETIEPLKVIDNLIPSDIYLKVETDGEIYLNNLNNRPYQFYLGVIPFHITAFQGFLDNSSTYNLSVFLNGNAYELDINTLQDQSKYTINITTELLEWNEIKFKISRKNKVYEETYYFFTKSPLGSFNWYPSQTINGITSNITPKVSYQHNYSGGLHSGTQFPGLKGLIKYTSATPAKTYAISDINIGDNLGRDCLISIGVNYSKLNDTKKIIFELLCETSSKNIQIYQDHIDIMGTTYENFYLPMSTGSFHLISLYRRAVFRENQSIYYEWVVYIDGIIETATSQFITDLETYSKITFNPALYDVNYVEISYFDHTTVNEDLDNNPNTSNNFYESFNPNPNKYPISYLTDSSILYHYYSYKLTYYPESISESFKNAYSYISQFYHNYKTGRTEVDMNLIQAVASNVDIPVILFKYEEPKSGDNHESDGENFMSWLEYRHDVTIDTGATSVPKKVDVFYSKGNSELKAVDISKYPNALFNIYLQGTSTLLYKSKNLDLEIASKDEDYTYLFSPNFDENDSSTFLPESRFTIKGDVVDSSHSNNNSIGKFINTVCTKFADAKQPGNKYSSYIKNALEGFPVLVFIQNSYYINNIAATTTDDFYFIGISNMNLGRDSEFNLGYKDLRLLPESIENGFAVTRINHNNLSENLNPKSYLPDFAVAEIRENRNYFDFSLSDPSFLFELEGAEDKDYMFSKFKSNSLDLLESSLYEAVKGVSRGGGYIFDKLGKNMLTEKKVGDNLGYGYDEGYKSVIPLNLVPNYKIELKRSFVNSKSVLTPTGNDIKGELTDLINTIIGDPENFIEPLIDYRALSEYYVICMALGLLDSVMKNLNLKKWNKRYYTSFYDMDTSLGKDNAGNNSNYICFSDYWEPKLSTLGGSTKLEPAMSYKDWFDKDVVGFDVPMTYLFALVKYGYQYAGSENLRDWYPNNLWARFRRSTPNISGWTLPSDANSNHLCCLKTADTYIDNYFKGHLEKVPDVIFNLNYRNKYLQINQDSKSFVAEEYKKLSGRRIYVVRDWLNSRFHLLDLYFNLAQVPDSILKYDLETLTWFAIENTSYKLPESMFIDVNNKDITILQDVFSSGRNTKYSHNINVSFTSDNYSPICLSGETIARYITKDRTILYKLEIESLGKSMNLGGSGSWLTLSSINSLILGGLFFADSDKLTTLNGTEGVCSSWYINLPALTSVKLTSPLYSNVLTFNNTENWPNLDSIDISGSKLGLNLDSLNITKILASGIKVGPELIIANCKNLKTIDIGNSTFTTITMTSVEPVLFFSKYTYTKNNNGSWQVTSTDAKSAKCKFLNLTRPLKDGILFVSDQTYVNGSVTEGLQEITLEGYKEVYISDCPFLSKIIIKDPETLEYISVKNSSTQTTSFQINSNDLYKIDLLEASNLKTVNFLKTKNFKYVYLSNGVELSPSAFELTNIIYLSGNNLKLNSSVFSLAHLFTLLQNDNSLCSFDTEQNIANLSSTFYYTNIDKNTFDNFNNTYTKLLGKVTNTSSMWAYSPCVKYNEDYLLDDINEGSSRFDLSMYTNVTNATQMMGGNSVTACHAGTLEGFGSANGVNLQNFYGWNNLSNITITVPINWLQHVSTKVTNCNTIVSSTVTPNFKFKIVDTNGTLLKTFSPVELFLGNEKNKIKALENWIFVSDHTIDFKDAFIESKFPVLTTIKRSFCGCNASNLEYEQILEGENGENQTIKAGCLYPNNNITEISGSFGFNNYLNITVDLGRYINWDTLKSGYKGFMYDLNWDEKYHVLEFNKTLNSSKLFKYIYSKLIENYTATSLSHVFLNCVLLTKNDVYITFDNISNSSIVKIPYLFTNFKTNDNSPILWDWGMMKNLPAVKEMQYTFSKMHVLNMLPLNFFNTKKLVDNGKIVYLKQNDDSFKEAKLYRFDYTLRITNLTYCFLDCKFDTVSYSPEEIIKDYNNLNSMSYLTDLEGNVLENTEYYTTADALYGVPKLISNTEFDDLYKEVSYSQELSTDYNVVIETTNNTVLEYNNYSVDGKVDLNSPFIPPDFFYACTNTVNLSYCFSGCNLQGYIPDNLLKYCKSANLNSFIKGVMIFPKYYDTRFSINFDKYFNIYYYIGSNFSDALTLDSAFNFRIALPGNNTNDIQELYVFCFKDSFNKNLNSLRNAFPTDIKELEPNTIFSILHYENKIYMNLMYDKDTEKEIVYEKDEDGNDITLDSLGNPIQTGPVIGNLGFDLTTYSNLYADNLIDGLYSQFTYGNVFDQNTTLNSIKRRYDSWVIYFGNSTNSFGISRNAIWPAATFANKNAIRIGSTLYYKDDNDNWLYNSSGNNLRIYKSNIIDYVDNITNKYYNNSSTTNWGLAFVEN